MPHRPLGAHFVALLGVAAALCAGAPASVAQPTIGNLTALERAVVEAPDAARLRAWHDMTASEPHLAGTPGDERIVDALVDAFTEMGLEVEKRPFWALLPRPVSASLSIVAPEQFDLPIAETPIDADPDTLAEDLPFGWNAYSATGTAEGEVVFANYGRKEDFERLAELGVPVEGRIVVARFGGNFRGYKAYYAQQAGAAGLVIYTDPIDSGYVRGLMWPEGVWANGSKIQRGSILTLPWQGDPLTPFIEATEDAERIDIADAPLPTIPVQPVGWDAAQEILGRMTGRPVEDREWQGGLPFTYRLEGGADLRVRVSVEQTREIVESWNVTATLPGAAHPEQKVFVGCHHDAWVYGAKDPACGLIVVLEAARAFAEAAQHGQRPDRSIVFCAWGAEEFGIIGSSEWVEGHVDALRTGAVAYINLDAAAGGPRFGASASPSLKPLIEQAAQSITNEAFVHGADAPEALADAWFGAAERPRFGNLGGGSDHVGFYCHAGVPSAGLGMRGAPGDSYHSTYDTLAHYRRSVGEDYGAALTLTRITNLVLARLAADPLVPLHAGDYARDLVRHLDAMRPRAAELGVSIDDGALRDAASRLEMRADETHRALADAVADGRLAGARLDAVNNALRSMEQVWLAEAGLPERPWFRNLFASTDPTSGYAAWMLPLLRYEVEIGNQEGVDEAIGVYAARLRNLEEMLGAVRALAGS
ncbi:MAG: M28 family peptidase [Phycisphaerales bacterium]